MFFQVDAGFYDVDAFAFEELFLKRGVRFADQDFSVGAEDAVPGNAFAARGRAHGSPRAAGPAT